MRFFIGFFFVALSGLFLILSTESFAQVPSSVEPGRIEKDIRRDLQRDLITIPELPYVGEDQIPDGAENITFVLKDITLDGADSVSSGDLSDIYAPYIGQEVSLAEIYGIAREITRRYRDLGFLLSQAVVPAQEIDNGTVRILVVEGRVDQYRIEGADEEQYGFLADYARKIAASGVVTASGLERYLLLMNDLPGVRVRAVLTPSLTTAGASDLILRVEEDFIEGYASVDTYGTEFLGPIRLSGGVSVVPFKSLNHELEVATLIAPDNGELQFFDVRYSQVIGDEGTELRVGGSYTHSQPTLPPGLGGGLGTQGEAYSVQVGVDHPVIRSREENLNVGVLYDHHKSQTFFDPVFFALDTEDQIRSVRGYLDYDVVDDVGGFNDLFVQISQGLDFFGASNVGGGTSRPQGEADYLKVDFRAERLQRLDNHFSFLTGVSGQYTSDALLATEEFGLGGRDFGRGFDASEITGDRGLAGKLELIYADQVDSSPYLRDYQVFGFYDIGAVWDEDPGAGQSARTSLASTGLGTRFSINDGLQGDAIFSYPLTNAVQSRGSHSESARFQFSLTQRF